jgi:hypothetical protein
VEITKMGIAPDQNEEEEEEEEEEEVNRLPVAWAEWPGRCWLRVHCRCAALLVLC